MQLPMQLPRLDTVASCVNGYDPHAMRLDVAKEFLTRWVRPIETALRVPIRSALGRVLAQDVVSGIDVPAYDNSAMDGYAFRGEALTSTGDTLLTIAGRSFAGDEPPAAPPADACVRIMTGAPLPKGLDTVVPQEFVELLTPEDGPASASSDMSGARIRIPPGCVRRGDNRRLVGEDLARGRRALPAGRLIRPADVGLLASLGLSEVSVWRPLRIAFFSTGSELRSLGEPLDPGCVYDSNRYTLWGMLARLGVEILDLGVVRDDPAALSRAFQRAANDADVIITSGGVGAGEADHTRSVMAQVGEVAFWSIAMRPGRPMAVGNVRASDGRNAALFGLPGNPVAVMTTFYALVRDALITMSGSTEPPPLTLQATSTAAIRKKPGRSEIQRAVVDVDSLGRLRVGVGPAQGSGILRSMSEANAFIVLGHDRGPVQAGELVDVMLFDGLM